MVFWGELIHNHAVLLLSKWGFTFPLLLATAVSLYVTQYYGAILAPKKKWRPAGSREITILRETHTSAARYFYFFTLTAVVFVEIMRLNSIDPYGGPLFWQVLRLTHYVFVAIFAVVFVAIPIERIFLRAKYSRIHRLLVRVLRPAFVAVLITGAPLFVALSMK